MNARRVLCTAILAAACTEPRRRGPATQADDGGAVDVPVLPDAGAPGLFDGSGATADPNSVLVYAHSRDTLYSYAPSSSQLSTLGRFRTRAGQDAPDITDLAINRAGELFAISFTSLYRVDPTDATVDVVGDLQIPSVTLNGLVFALAGQLGAGEVLVAVSQLGSYFAIDVESGRASSIGHYPAGWNSSGDVVAVEGLGTYAAVRDTSDSRDILVQVRFAADGSSEFTRIGEIGSDRVYGLAYWGDSLYGFTNTGALLRIDPATGEVRSREADTGTDAFWGAGVTTLAPVLQ
jgi:hypothetical protein